MKEKFVDTAFTPKALEVINHANVIIEEYLAQGYDLSVRQLFYQFVSRNIHIGGAVFANTDRNYENLAAMISKARLAGLVDWGAIKDRHRVTQGFNTHKDLKAFMAEQAESYRRTKWSDQPNYVEVMVEKMALEGVLLPICERWDVSFTANKGYSSSSSLYERGKYLQSMRDVEGKEVHVIYLGDHDPSGVDMSRDVLDRLSLLSDGVVHVHRVALTIDQVHLYHLPENPAKVTDGRAAAYIERYGPSSWELDAIEPATLVQLVEGKIRELVHMSSWDKQVETQAAEKERLQDIVEALSQ